MFLTFAEAAALLDATRRLSGLPPPADSRFAPVRARERRSGVAYQEERTLGDPEPLFYPLALPERNDGRDPGLDAYSADSGELIASREVDPC